VKALLAAVLLLGPSAPAPDPVPPGGYWRFGERRDPEPNDGRDNLMIGTIMTSLGLLRTASGVAYVVMAQPDRCDDLDRFGIDPASCPQVRGFGWAGVAFGGAFLVTGVTMLAIGGVQRKRHRAWERRYGISLAPAVSRDRLGFEFALRF
jgi:hypothetical protein